MALFKNLEEIREYLPVASTFGFDKMLPVIKNVQADVLEPYCGSELIRNLDTAYNDSADLTIDDLPAKSQELLRMIQEPLALISLVRYIPIGEVQFTSSGISTMGESDQRKAAEDKQIVRLRANLLSMGMNSLERLLAFLEKKNSDYPAHQVVLDARPKTILPNAVEFSKYYQIHDSHLTYRGLLSLITEKEEDVIAPLLGNYYTEIASTATLTGEKLRLRNKAKRALAYLCVADAIELNMAVELSADGLRLNFTSQIGNVKYYTPPDNATRLSVLAAANRKANSMTEEIGRIVSELDGNTDTGTGLVDSTGSGIVML